MCWNWQLCSPQPSVLRPKILNDTLNSWNWYQLSNDDFYWKQIRIWIEWKWKWLLQLWTIFSSSEYKAWKKFRPVWDLNPWPLWYQCSALPTALMSPLEAGLNVGSKLCLFTYLSMVFHIWFSHIHSHWYGLSWAEESSLLFKDSLNQVCVNPGLWLTVLDREALGY